MQKVLSRKCLHGSSTQSTFLDSLSLCKIKYIEFLLNFNLKVVENSGRTFLKPDFCPFLAGSESTFVDISGSR